MGATCGKCASLVVATGGRYGGFTVVAGRDIQRPVSVLVGCAALPSISGLGMLVGNCRTIGPAILVPSLSDE